MSKYVKGIRIDWSKIARNSYVREIPAISILEELLFHKNITFLVGENGTGKSTFLEALAIAYGLNPEGGTKNFYFDTYNTCSDLEKRMCIIKSGLHPEYSYFLRAESFG